MKICAVPECAHVIDFTKRGNRAITCSPECQVIHNRAYKTRYKRERYQNDAEYREQHNSARRTPAHREKVRESNRIAKQRSRKRLEARNKFKIRKHVNGEKVKNHRSKNDE